MFLSRKNWAHPEFSRGLRDQVTVTIGFATWGLMTGVALVKYGLSVFDAILMTVVVYAASAQLAAVPLMMAGAPLWVILAAAFCVNLRFVVFSAHLRPYLMHLPRWQRLISGYFTVDLTYVVFTKRFPTPGRTPDELAAQQAYLMGNCAVSYVGWMCSAVLGILLAHAIPAHWGLGFAGILALIGVMGSLLNSPLRVLAAVVAGAVSVAAFALPLKLHVLLAIVSTVLVCLVLERMEPHEPRGVLREKGAPSDV